MRIIVEPTKGLKDIQVEGMNGQYKLADIAKGLREKAGFKSAGAFQTYAGLDHPNWINLEKGRSHSLAVFVLGLDELGYNVTISKRP